MIRHCGEFNDAKFSQRKWKFHNNEERVVIPCLNHKTGPQGVVQLVANTDSEGGELLLQYHTLVRAKITLKPGGDQLFFLTCSVGRYSRFTGKYVKA